MQQQDLDLLDHIEHAVFVIEPDADGLPRYTAFSGFACRLLGKTEKEILGLSAKELYPGRLGTIAFDHHAATLKSRMPRTYEILLPIQETQRRVRTTLIPVIEDDGKVTRLVGSSADVSGSQIIREMQAGVDTLKGEMEDFVSLAAHDLRSPIRQVRGIAALLRDDFRDLGDGKLELINILEELAAKAMTLISDLLSHAQATSVTEERVDFDFADLANEIMALLDPMALCSFSVTPGRVVGDRTATQIILRNLIDNAIKHARADNEPEDEIASAPALHLTITLGAAVEGYFEVAVGDNGTGFGNAAIEFLNGGKLRTDSGFGLLGVRRLIYARRGTLTATNGPNGSGAIVSFTLPGQSEIDPGSP